MNTSTNTVENVAINHLISEATFVACLTSAFTNSKYALQQELAINLAVYYAYTNVSRPAKQALMQIYGKSGWDCLTPKGADYKTTSRRINVGSLLYTHLGYELIGEWCADKEEMAIISSITERLAAYDISTIDGCLALVGQPRAEKPALKVAPKKADYVQSEAKISVTPSDDSGAYQNWLVQHGETPLENKWSVQQGFRHLELEFVTINIAPTASKESLIAAAMKLMELASTMDGVTSFDAPTEPSVDIPEFIRKSSLEIPQATLDTPLRAALKSLLDISDDDATDDDLIEDAQAIIQHQEKEATALAESKKPAPVVASAPRYRKGSTKPIKK